MKPPKQGYYWITTIYRHGELLVGYYDIDGWQVLPWPGIPDDQGFLKDDEVTWHGDAIETQYPPEEGS